MPIVESQHNTARESERIALSVSRGERQWREAGGPEKSIKADQLGHMVDFLKLLANGKNSSSWNGWIDRREWKSIIEAVNA